MHVTGIKMIGRASRTQIHDHILSFIINILAGNSKLVHQSNITQTEMNCGIITLETFSAPKTELCFLKSPAGKINLNS